MICRRYGCGRKLERVMVTENEAPWLCPCCDNSLNIPCAHVLEERRRDRLERLRREISALPERDRAELFRDFNLFERHRL